CGDELLRSVARRLESSLRPTDVVAIPATAPATEPTVARLGGDEFVILLHDVRDVGDATRVAERVQRVLAEPFVIGGREIFTSVSIGIAFGDEHVGTPRDLLSDADTAMARAKSLGRGRIEVFDIAMRERVLDRLRLDTALRLALERDEFLPHYQPIVDLQTGRLAGFEALARWRQPDGRLVPPGVFVPIIEDNGLVVPFGRAITAAVCRQLRDWRAAYPGGAPVWVNVNFTSSQFAEPGVLDALLATLAEHGLGPRDLVVEITESAAIGNIDRAAEILQQFRDVGLRVVLDDFGTGYSSLSCLHELPIEGIKLDRSFIGSERRHPAILGAIVRLAEELGLSVTAEGIETGAQHEQLRALGCGYAQGYLFARPLDAEAAGALVRDRAVWRPQQSATSAA
ncbi:MAG: bifunctional diguanylate cyclase/phosphodiesterase, partial [Acidobacteriota bacterium]|nr:bifunctional diguanylate cyclase/phosphodiesterase [Acidobacteriota bacterium]